MLNMRFWKLRCLKFHFNQFSTTSLPVKLHLHCLINQRRFQSNQTLVLVRYIRWFGFFKWERMLMEYPPSKKSETTNYFVSLTGKTYNQYMLKNIFSIKWRSFQCQQHILVANDISINSVKVRYQCKSVHRVIAKADRPMVWTRPW